MRVPLSYEPSGKTIAFARMSAASEARRVPQARRFSGAERSKAALEIEPRIASKATHSNSRRAKKDTGAPAGKPARTDVRSDGSPRSAFIRAN